MTGILSCHSGSLPTVRAPVVLTALAAILAMIPLSRSAFWGPMATTIMGGLFVATFLISCTCRAFSPVVPHGLKESGRGEEAASAMQHEGNARPAIPLAEAAE